MPRNSDKIRWTFRQKTTNFGNILARFTANCEMPLVRKNTSVEFGAVQKRVNLVDLEKMLEKIQFKNAASIRPRTDLLKFGQPPTNHRKLWGQMNTYANVLEGSITAHCQCRNFRHDDGLCFIKRTRAVDRSASHTVLLFFQIGSGKPCNWRLAKATWLQVTTSG